MRTLALAACLALPRPGAAAQDAAVSAEIDALLERLARSGCEFQRNGSWYAAADARAHLQRKREVLESRAALRDAEQFIELAASASSVSGKPYLVRCAGGAPAESRAWLGAQLQSIRGTRGAPAR
ncbi:MAG: DUF5329 domain-containing protein [Burkholderiaceae bacterium]